MVRETSLAVYRALKAQVAVNRDLVDKNMALRALALELGDTIKELGDEDPGVHHGRCADLCFSEFMCWSRDEVEDRCLAANAVLEKLKEATK